MVHPAIPDGGIRRKFGEHGGHGKDSKLQPDDLKHSICDLKQSFADSKRSICQPDNSKHSILLQNHNMNMILGHLNIGQRQATRRGQPLPNQT